MRRVTISLIVVVTLFLSQVICNSSSMARAQGDNDIARIDLALTQLREARGRSTAELEGAERAGEKENAGELRRRLARVNEQLRVWEAKREDAVHASEAESKPRDEHPEIVAARRQVEHLRAAQEHLAAIEFKDMADTVGKRADEIQQAIRRHEAERKEQTARDRQETDRASRGEPMEVIIKELTGAVRKLRGDVDKLREEVSGLRENVERKEKSDR